MSRFFLILGLIFTGALLSPPPRARACRILSYDLTASIPDTEVAEGSGEESLVQVEGHAPSYCVSSACLSSSEGTWVFPGVSPAAGPLPLLLPPGSFSPAATFPRGPLSDGNFSLALPAVGERVSGVPEPSTLLLVGAGSLGAVGGRWWRQRRARPPLAASSLTPF